MRLPPIIPADLTPIQKTLYDDMRAGIAKGFLNAIAASLTPAILILAAGSLVSSTLAEYRGSWITHAS